MRIKTDILSVRKWCGNVLFTLLILVIMLDPTNTALHLKDIFFVALVAYNIAFYKPDLRYVPHLVLVFTMVILCYVFAEIQQNHIDYDELLAVFKSMSPLVLLLWIKHYDVINLSKVPAIITCLVLGVLYIIVSSSEEIEILVFTYMKQHDDMIMMSRRTIMGFTLFGMYYKSLVCLMFALFFFYYKLYNAKRWRFLYILTFVVMTFAFLVSGTRSSMLLPFFMFAFVSYRTIAKLRFAKYVFYPLLVLFCLSFLLVLLTLAMEKTEASNTIKYAHLTSYMQLFDAHPQYFLFGQGPGTWFYSIGFGRYTTVTEWTYVELVRNYGIWCVLFLAVVLNPIRTFFKYRKDSYTFGIMGTYVAYLLIAGTNPLLISSTGMLVVLSAYSYAEILKNNPPEMMS